MLAVDFAFTMSSFGFSDNHKDDYILEKTDMPDELVREVGGKPIFEQTLPLVCACVSVRV